MSSSNDYTNMKEAIDLVNDKLQRIRELYKEVLEILDDCIKGDMAEEDEYIDNDVIDVNVVFRKLEGGVIAIFPDEGVGRGQCLSYMHIGQHSGCNKELIEELPAATLEEVKDLIEELESIGYRLHFKE